MVDLARLTRSGGGATLHPPFDVSVSSAHVQALLRFHELTLARLSAGDCGPPGLSESPVTCH
jgi:hypothetical protein